jgi:REP element-mobilizing transposase RayT
MALAPRSAVSDRRPPRIDGFDYIGPHAYFLTVCTLNRVPWFSDQSRADGVVAELIRTTAAYGFGLIAYCLMPDHLHAMAEGARRDSNFLKYVAMFKQRTAFEHASRGRGRLWQAGFFEHVIRREEDFESVAAYIVANPIRAGLCRSAIEYRYLGSSRYTLQQLAEAAQMIPSWR